MTAGWSLSQFQEFVAGMPFRSESQQLDGYPELNSALEDLIVKIQALNPAERDQAVAGLGKALPGLRRAWNSDVRVSLVVSLLEATPAQFAASVTWWAFAVIQRYPSVWQTLRDAVIARGPQWAAEVVELLAARRSEVIDLAEFIDDLVLIHELPVPGDGLFWEGWMVTRREPVPGRRWQEHFLAACAGSRRFEGGWAPTNPSALTALREVEPTDDESLLAALISFWERGDRAGVQRGTLEWIAYLGLEPLIWVHRAQVLAALPMADARVVTYAVDQLLRPELADAELMTLAQVVLPRKEKGVKKKILVALKRVTSPSTELMAELSAVTAGSDTQAASLAAELLSGWGYQADDAVEASGLWRDPAGFIEVPLPSPMALDTVALAEPLGALANDWQGSAAIHEETLGALVATAAQHGRHTVVQAICDYLPVATEHENLLHQVLSQLVVGEPTPLAAPLSQLVLARAQQVAAQLGKLPCLLSMPSHSGFRLSWEVFAQRAQAYREWGVGILSADLAVALGRLDRASVASDLGDFAQPIHGLTVTLEEVLTSWRDTPSEPGQVVLRAAEEPLYDAPYYVFTRLEAVGDEASYLDLLGLSGAWTAPYRPLLTSPPFKEVSPVFALLPAHPTRPFSLVLEQLSHWGAHHAVGPMQLLAQTLPRLGTEGAFVLVAMLGRADPKQRDAVASLVLDLWDQGRVSGNDLAAAWSARPEAWDLSGSKLMSAVVAVAEAGGLAGVWPLMTELVEELATPVKVPPAMAGVLEMLLRFLPEVPQTQRHPLPQVAALAARKGSSKAVQLARQIVETLNDLA